MNFISLFEEQVTVLLRFISTAYIIDQIDVPIRENWLTIEFIAAVTQSE